MKVVTRKRGFGVHAFVQATQEWEIFATAIRADGYVVWQGVIGQSADRRKDQSSTPSKLTGTSQPHESRQPRGLFYQPRRLRGINLSVLFSEEY